MSATQPSSAPGAAFRGQSGGLSFLQRLMMAKFYKEAAGDPAKLPWHRDEPGALLVKCATRRKSGRALDVGCGSGVFSRYLASLGYEVVAVDLKAEAAAMARRLAAEGPSYEVIQADILALDWRPVGPYRRSERTIRAAFEPQFRLRETEAEVVDVPFPLGPKVRGVSYHFKRR